MSALWQVSGKFGNAGVKELHLGGWPRPHQGRLACARAPVGDMQEAQASFREKSGCDLVVTLLMLWFSKDLHEINTTGESPNKSPFHI